MKLFNNHPSEGELRAYQDQALPAQEQRRVQTHLENCAHCREVSSVLRARSQQIETQFSLLEPETGITQNKKLQATYAHLADRLEYEKEKSNMKSSIFGRVPRIAWALLIIVGVLAIALTFEPVRALANSFLALFRVEEIRVVQVNDTDLPNKLQNSTQLEYIMSKDVKVDVQGNPQEITSAEEAGKLLGFPLHLPANAQALSFTVTPAARMNFTVNLELIRGVLKDIQREDIQLPDNLDGALVQVDVPKSVTAKYGECEIQAPSDQTDPNSTPVVKRNKKCTTLSEVTSPVVSAPPDFDLTQLGQAYLEVIGMSPEEAVSFAQNIDWTTTFVVPLPLNYGNYEEVDVSGTKGVLVFNQGSEPGYYSLIWLRDGIIYALNGWGDSTAALSIANSIQ
jgi:hypothetical protein